MFTWLLALFSWSIWLTCSYLNQQNFDIKEQYNYEYLCIKRPLNTSITKDFDFLNESFKHKEYTVPILMFHYIQDIPSTSKDQLWYRLSYSPQNLAKLLDTLDRNDITPITFYDLKLINEWKIRAPKKMIILSFDDGHKDHYTNAFSILKERWMKWVFYIISWKVDKDWMYMNSQEIQEMVDDWQEIASHTVSHLNIAKLSNDKIYHELIDSKKYLENRFGINVISFSYPAWKYQNEYLKKLCWETYSFCRTTQPWIKYTYNNRSTLPTYRMNPTTTIQQVLNLYK